MKAITVLVLFALFCQLCGFNVCLLTNNEDSQTYWYNLCDSVAWTVFALAALRITKQIKTIGRNVTFVKETKLLRLVIEFFMVLTVCPLVNDMAGKSSDRLVTNFIFGLFALTYYTVKIRTKWKT